MGISKCSFKDWCLNNGHQDWLDLWDYELNSISPDQVSSGSHKKLWFLCPRGIHDSYQREIRLLTRGDSSIFCRKCNSIGQFLIDCYGDDALERMWSDRNTTDPFEVAKYNSRPKIWLKCDNGLGHPDSEYIPNSVSDGALCKTCSGATIITGENDVATLYPDYLKYFKNPQDAKTTGCWSERTVDLICPDCGSAIQKRVCNLLSYRFNCPICGDAVSYPNKFMHAFLSQLKNTYPIEIFPEHVFEWSKCLSGGRKRRIYDFYIRYNNIEMIIEVHGRQHYDGSFSGFEGANSLQDEMENDRFKMDLALRNGIRPGNYVVIDARRSSSEWIKNSIYESKLREIFSIDDIIDWDLCELMAQKSTTHIVADLLKSNVMSVKEIAEKIGKSRPVTIEYLHRASKLGLCNYRPRYTEKHNRLPVFCISDNIMFSSLKACEENGIDALGIRVNAGSLANSARSGSKYRGKQFKYVTREQFDEFYKTNPHSTYVDEYFIPTK